MPRRHAAAISGILFAVAAILVVTHQPDALEAAIRAMVPSGGHCAIDAAANVKCDYPPGPQSEVSAVLLQNRTTIISVDPDQKAEAYMEGTLKVHRLQGFNSDEVSTCMRGAAAKGATYEIAHGHRLLDCWINSGVLVFRTQKGTPF